MLSVSAWNHTHGARYQNRTGTYCLEGSRSAINLIRRKEWATITAVTQGGFKEDEEYWKKREGYTIPHANSYISKWLFKANFQSSNP